MLRLLVVERRAVRGAVAPVGLAAAEAVAPAVRLVRAGVGLAPSLGVSFPTSAVSLSTCFLSFLSFALLPIDYLVLHPQSVGRCLMLERDTMIARATLA